jgi:hypothetical protein
VTDPASPGQPYGQPYGGQPGQPYGGQPYGGQPGQPYGGQPGQPYGAPPPQSGTPFAGYGGEAPPPSPYGAAPPPAKKGGAGKVIGIVAGVLVLLLIVCGVIGVFAFNSAKKDPANAKVGNCLASDKLDSTTAQEVKNVKVVDCGSSSATYKVVGIVSNKTQTDFTTDNEICKAYPTAVSAIWQGPPGESGSVLCLEQVKH